MLNLLNRKIKAKKCSNCNTFTPCGVRNKGNCNTPNKDASIVVMVSIDHKCKWFMSK